MYTKQVLSRFATEGLPHLTHFSLSTGGHFRVGLADFLMIRRRAIYDEVAAPDEIQPARIGSSPRAAIEHVVTKITSACVW
jgi:hypothetical protein